MAVKGLKRPYPPETIEKALTAIAITGSMKEAADIVGVPYNTVTSWRYNHAERLEQIKRDRAPQIDAACITSFRDIVLNANRATLLGVQKTEAALEAGELNDPAGATRNMATTAAIAADKMLLIDGRATSIVQHRSPDEVMQRLEAKGYIVDSTAEEDEGGSPLPPPPSERQAANARELNS